MQKPFNVKDITDLPEEPDIENEIERLAPGAGFERHLERAKAIAKSQTESELGSFMVLCKDDVSWIKVTFVEDSGYRILRIGVEGRDSLDLVLNNDHLQAFLSQWTLWITR